MLNETCRKADGLKQRRNQLQDLSAVPSEVAENKLMPIQKAKLLLIPHGQQKKKLHDYILIELLKVACKESEKHENHGEDLSGLFPASPPAPTFSHQTCRSAINQ